MGAESFGGVEQSEPKPNQSEIDQLIAFQNKLSEERLRIIKDNQGQDQKSLDAKLDPGLKESMAAGLLEGDFQKPDMMTPARVLNELKRDLAEQDKTLRGDRYSSEEKASAQREKEKIEGKIAVFKKLRF